MIIWELRLEWGCERGKNVYMFYIDVYKSCNMAKVSFRSWNFTKPSQFSEKEYWHYKQIMNRDIEFEIKPVGLSFIIEFEGTLIGTAIAVGIGILGSFLCLLIGWDPVIIITIAVIALMWIVLILLFEFLSFPTTNLKKKLILY